MKWRKEWQHLQAAVMINASRESQTYPTFSKICEPHIRDVIVLLTYTIKVVTILLTSCLSKKSVFTWHQGGHVDLPQAVKLQNRGITRTERKMLRLNTRSALVYCVSCSARRLIRLLNRLRRLPPGIVKFLSTGPRYEFFSCEKYISERMVPLTNDHHEDALLMGYPGRTPIWNDWECW